MSVSLIKFGLLVKVIAGFYTGCYGTILEDGKGSLKGIQVYTSITCRDGLGAHDNLTTWVELSSIQPTTREEFTKFLRAQ